MTQLNQSLRLKRELTSKNLVLFVVLIALAGILFLLRQVILMGLAAIIVAVLLSDAERLVKKTTKLSRPFSLALAFALILCGAISISWVFGAQISTQISELTTTLPAGLGQLQQRLESDPVGRVVVTAVSKEFEGVGTNNTGLAARAGGFAYRLFDIFIQSLVIVTAGIFLAGNPMPYRGAILRLLPKAQHH